MTAVLAYTASTAARQGWDATDARLLGEIRRCPTMPSLLESTKYPDAIVRDAVLGYQRGGLVVAVVDGGVRYELTLMGWARLGQLADHSTVPAMWKAA